MPGSVLAEYGMVGNMSQATSPPGSRLELPASGLETVRPITEVGRTHDAASPCRPMTWTFRDYERAAAELMPRTKSYEWAFRILRQAQIYGEEFALRREKILKRFVSRRKPYFVFYTSDGLRVVGDYRDRHARRAALYPDDEALLADMIVGLVDRKPGLFIDVGTNMGLLAAAVARRRPNQQVVAIEADPKTSLRAAATFGLNRLENVRLVQAAASDRDGSIAFYSPAGRSDAGSVTELEGNRVSKLEVPRVRLDDLDFGQEPVSLIRFDVQGHELHALRGGRDLIANHLPAITFEYRWDIAPRVGWKIEEAERFLRGLGDYQFRVWNSGGYEIAYPPTKSDGPVSTIIATVD